MSIKKDVYVYGFAYITPLSYNICLSVLNEKKCWSGGQNLFLLLDEPITVDENKAIKKETPAQDKATERLNVLNESIASLVNLEKKLGLTPESKARLKSLMAKREATKNNLKRLKSLVKSQQKLRVKRKQVLKEIASDHPEIASKLKKLEVKKTTGRPNLESQIDGLHEAILSIVVPE